MRSIRADAATEILTRTTNLPKIDLFTWMGWVYFSVLAGDNYRLTFHRGGDAVDNFLAVGAWDNGGFKTYLSDYTNDWSGSAVSINTWYHYCWTRSGNTHTLFLNGVPDIVQTSSDNPATAVAHIFGKSSGGGNPMNGRVACVKEWSGVALKAWQVRREMRQYQPRECLSQLNGFWPMSSLADYAIDYSPRRNKWTVGGTPTAEDGPPIPWGSSVKRPSYFSLPGSSLVRTNRASTSSGETSNNAYGTGSFSTGSFTPSNNSLLVAVVGGASESDISGSDYSVSGGGLAWTLRGTVTAISGGYRTKLQIWTAPVTTGASMTVTVDHAASMHTWQVNVFDYTGYNTSSPIGATGSDTALEDAGTFTLSGSPAYDSEVIAARFLVPNEVTNEAAVPGVGWTEQYDRPQTSGFGWGGMQTQTRTLSTSSTVSWVDTTVGNTAFTNVGLAIEIKAGGNDQNITLTTGIASAEAFGTHTVTAGAVSVSPSAISSAETFGTNTITTGGVSISPSVISSAEAFGTHTVTTGEVSISPTGIASGEAFGTHTVSPGPVTITATGIASQESFGSVIVAGPITISGISSGEAFGSASVAVVAVVPEFESGVNIGDRPTTSNWQENSGVAAGVDPTFVAENRNNTDYIWHISDGSLELLLPQSLYDGSDGGAWTLGAGTAVDVEDVASRRVDSTSYVYIGDTGDNSSARSSVQIFRCIEPQIWTEPEPSDYPFGTELVRHTFDNTLVNAGTGGATYDGSFSGNATYSSTSKFGSHSLTGDGTGDGVDSLFGSGVNPSTTGFTISGWFNWSGTSSGTTQHIFGVSSTADNRRWYARYRHSTGTWGFRVQGVAEVTTDVTVVSGQWYHIAMVADPSVDQCRFYVNGVLKGSSSYTSFTLSANIYIGTNRENGSIAHGEGFRGLVDDFAIYNSALDASTITEIFNAGAAAGAFGGTIPSGDIETITCQYPGGGSAPSHKDCETLFVDTNGDMYLLTKRITPARLYRLEHESSYVGTQTLEYLGEIWTPPQTVGMDGTNGGYYVGGDVSADGSLIVLRGYENLYLFNRGESESIFDALQVAGVAVDTYVGKGNHPDQEPKGEGVCFVANGDLISTSEYMADYGSGDGYPTFRYARIYEEQELSPSSIDSGEAFGSATVSPGPVTITATGIATAEAFGSHTVTTGEVTVSPSSIASLEAFGDHIISVGGTTLIPTGINSEEAFGDHIISAGEVTVSPSSIASLETFGDHTITTGEIAISPSSIASLEAFGSHTITTGEVAISPVAIASLEAFGSHTITAGTVELSPTSIDSLEIFGDHIITTGEVTVSPSSITSSEAFGDHIISAGGTTLIPTAINSEEAFGSHTITTGEVAISPTSINSGESFGTHAFTAGTVELSPTSINSGESFGSHTITTGEVVISPTSIASLEAFGTHTIVTGEVSVSPTSIASLEAFGSHTITTGEVAISPTSINSAESFGSHTITTGEVAISPTSINSAEAFGDHIISAGGTILQVDGIASVEAFGTATITTGAVQITASGISSAEAFGSHIISAGEITLQPTSIDSAEAFGSHIISAGEATIQTISINSAEAFGTTSITAGTVVITTTGIDSAEVFGTHIISAGSITIQATSVNSAEEFGSHIVATDTVFIQPSPIASGEAFGTPTIVAGEVTVSPTAIPTQESFGTPEILRLVSPDGIGSGELFGTARLDQEILLTGIDSQEAFGNQIVNGFPQTLYPDGISDGEFGDGKLIQSWGYYLVRNLTGGPIKVINHIIPGHSSRMIENSRHMYSVLSANRYISFTYFLFPTQRISCKPFIYEEYDVGTPSIS